MRHEMREAGARGRALPERFTKTCGLRQGFRVMKAGLSSTRSSYGSERHCGQLERVFIQREDAHMLGEYPRVHLPYLAWQTGVRAMREQAAKSFTDGLCTRARNNEANFPYVTRHPEDGTEEGAQLMHVLIASPAVLHFYPYQCSIM